MSKDLLFGDDASKKIREGVRKLSQAVKLTLGPTGRNVVIQKCNKDGSLSPPLITKDGVTVAKEVDLKDPFENLGAQMVKEVACKTSDVAGDGTTTATVLAEAIFEEGAKLVAAGADAMSLKRGIDIAVKVALDSLVKLSTPINGKEQVAQVGSISANNDKEIGDLLSTVMDKVGKDGVVTVEQGKTYETTIEMVEGMQFDRGYLSPYFVTNPDKGIAEWEMPYILFYDGKISAVKEIVPVLEKTMQGNLFPLVIIADEVDGDALTTLAINRAKGGLQALAIRAPSFGDNRKEILQDMAILTGGSLISKQAGDQLEELDTSKLGRAKKIVASKDKTTLIDGEGKEEEIKARIASIQEKLSKAESEFEVNALKERLGKLSGGIAMIWVGAASEIEMKEKKARVEDALHATRAAIEEGVVPGGGVALLRCVDSVKVCYKGLHGDEANGAKIVEKALTSPLFHIASNAGHSGDSVVEKVLRMKGPRGFNARTNVYEDLIKAGVIDPTKVTRTALQNAASVAGLMLTNGALLVEQVQEKSSNPPMQF